MIKIKSKTQNGITLIALVVTIVVLLILAGVSINMVFSDGGILDKAKSAEKKSTIAKEKEIVEMAYLAVSTEKAGGEITPDDLQAELENMTGTNKTVTTFDEDGYLLVKFLETGNEYNINEMGVGKTAEETFSEIATETKKYTDGNGKTAIIPKGFAVGTSDTINKVDNGLVIQDKDGNQFVWIPAVGYVGNGFYIGRYEAGSEKERTENTATTPAPVVQRDKFVYNYVNFGEAVSLCESMYSNLDSVNSYLIQAKDIKNIMDNIMPQKISQQVGNFFETTFNVTRGKYAMIKDGDNTPYSPYYSEDTGIYKDVKGLFTKPITTQVIFTTGASDRNKVKNIFDVYGNVMEWCDAEVPSNLQAVYGGAFIQNYFHTNSIAGLSGGREWDIFNDNPNLMPLDRANQIIYCGFRPVLYINESTYNF